MPEIRASLTTELHRKLKAEAAREGVHLKDLVAQILEKHLNSQRGGKKPK
jgi:predicted HicB family RNase H-like nuclease